MLPKNITLNYKLTNEDYIEAKQLQLRKSPSTWFSLLFTVIFIIYGFIDLQRISNSDFLIFEYLKSLFVSEEFIDNRLASALFNFGTALLVSSNTFPKYNPIYRWSLFQKYKENFVQQEIKNLIIDENSINIESHSYRESRQWQDFTQFRENKNILLLYGSKEKTVVIPKRIFTNTAEIDNIRTLLKVKIM